MMSDGDCTPGREPRSIAASYTYTPEGKIIIMIMIMIIIIIIICSRDSPTGDVRVSNNRQ